MEGERENGRMKREERGGGEQMERGEKIERGREKIEGGGERRVTHTWSSSSRTTMDNFLFLKCIFVIFGLRRRRWRLERSTNENE